MKATDVDALLDDIPDFDPPAAEPEPAAEPIQPRRLERGTRLVRTFPPSWLDNRQGESIPVGDRSQAVWTMVNCCLEAGASDAQAVDWLAGYAPAREKWPKEASRRRNLAKQVAKARRSKPHGHVGSWCADVGCGDTPRWMNDRDQPPRGHTAGPPPADDDDDQGDDDEEEAQPFTLETAADVAARVDAAPPVGWLVNGIWPADAYGALAATKKAGKTWADLDFAVAVASGGRWLGLHQVAKPGPVALFLGEGGERKMIRRLRAVADHHEVDEAELFEQLHLVFRVPHLTVDAHLARLAKEICRVQPVLVIIDPLYLAARGAESSSLIAMGEVLERVQHVCQAAGSALLVVHHWNKTGQGKGSDRMSGVGLAEWGRVLITMDVKSKSEGRKPMSSLVSLEFLAEGDEIPDTEFHVQREVWADRPEDLDSPLHYVIAPIDNAAPQPGGLSPGKRRLLDVIESDPERWWSAKDLAEVMQARFEARIDQFKPLKNDTLSGYCKEFVEAGLLDVRTGTTKFDGHRWQLIGP